MGGFVKGEVVVVPFPFSDISETKVRPALVVANLSGDDLILCMITSVERDADSIPLTNADFLTGRLAVDSNIRPNRLFTAEDSIILRSKGRLLPAKMQQVTAKIIEVLRR
jgi:mRNA interferase MazF